MQNVLEGKYMEVNEHEKLQVCSLTQIKG